MALHPTQVQWFEAKIPRQHSVHALEILASSQRIELEATTEATEPCFDCQALARILDKFSTLASRIPELPNHCETPPERLLLHPVELAERALASLRDWHLRLLELQREQRQLENRQKNLELIRELLASVDEESLNLREFGKTSPFLGKHVYVCPKAMLEDPHADGTVNRVIEGEQHDFWVVLSEPEQTPLLDGTAALLDCSALAFPDDLPPTPAAGLRYLGQALQLIKTSQASHREAIARHLDDPSLSQAQANVRLLRWYVRHPLQQDPTSPVCRVTGWTLYPDPEAMERLLQDGGIEARVIFGPPRGGLSPPVYLSQSHWARPFQNLLGMVGTPGRHEVDPTPLLAWLVPLLFGFMFPDLGHGLVLAAIGRFAARRYPAAGILVSCGLAASGFGLLFGEFFGATGVLPALFGCPLEHPQEILLATLLLGVSLMMTGLLLAGLECYWRGDFGRWLLEEAPIVALYLSAACALLWPDALLVTLAAGLWYLAGITVLSLQDGLHHLLGRLGRLFESSLQLVVNTLSFLRVGAFALAHCALSLMVLRLSDSVENPLLQASVFVLGQILIILVEGLIVTIQTTRLILFEFFIRFMRFEGRIYRPLETPETEELAASREDKKHPGR